MAEPSPHLLPVDPFDLPAWLGTSDVTWTATSSVRDGHRVSGELTPTDAGQQEDPLACDLLGVDQAYPQPVLDDDARRQAHQVWNHGRVHLGEYDGRLTLTVPGTGFTADLVLETVGRLAQAVGVPTGRFVVALRL